MRTALLVSSLLLAACTVGEVGTANAPAGGGTDAGSGSGSGSGSGIGTACVNRATAGPAHDHGNGVTHAGENCLQVGSCHLNNSPAPAGPPFQFAGTVYKTDGVTPNSGVNLRIKQKAGTGSVTLVSDLAGNFSIAAGSLQQAFPAAVDATACPTVKAMMADLVQGNGGCNSCHVAGKDGPITLADQ
ncbi:MAG TPA: hypothetical protein VFK02_12950 [Kofleriaceae bacterium]|nr:hypothetical protein [Kofleriaceae bacterium]